MALSDLLERGSRYLFTLGLPRVRELPPGQAAELAEWAEEEDERRHPRESTMRMLALVGACLGLLAWIVSFLLHWPVGVKLGAMPAGVAAFVAMELCLRGRRKRRLRELLAARMASHKPWCAKCDYDLRVITVDRCPECGAPIERAQSYHAKCGSREFTISVL